MTIDPTPAGEWSGLRRLAAWISGLTLVGLLFVARGLTPDPSGQGTHQQLGLPPCTLIALFDMPCPSCGMTTSWAHFTRGQPLRAATANLGGTLLCIATMIAGPWLILSAWSGRWVGWRLSERLLLMGIAVIAAVTLLDWLRRMFFPEM